MALTSPPNSRASEVNTPTPYRVSTEVVRTWQPRQATTVELAAIRDAITPNRGWWQFRLPPMPWQAVLAFQVWFVTVAVGASLEAAFLYFLAHR